MINRLHGQTNQEALAALLQLAGQPTAHQRMCVGRLARSSRRSRGLEPGADRFRPHARLPYVPAARCAHSSRDRAVGGGQRDEQACSARPLRRDRAAVGVAAFRRHVQPGPDSRRFGARGRPHAAHSVRATNRRGTQNDGQARSCAAGALGVASRAEALTCGLARGRAHEGSAPIIVARRIIRC